MSDTMPDGQRPSPGRANEEPSDTLDRMRWPEVPGIEIGLAVTDGLLDRVIQHIYSAGLLLEQSHTDVADERIAQAVDALDRAMTDIRSSVLQWRASGRAPDRLASDHEPPAPDPTSPAGRHASEARPVGDGPPSPAPPDRSRGR
jgi:hypothetical protein